MTIRLLDPPLHEFLPRAHEVQQEVERARIEQSDDLAELERTLERASQLAETNPMLGTRGVRQRVTGGLVRERDLERERARLGGHRSRPPSPVEDALEERGRVDGPRDPPPHAVEAGTADRAVGRDARAERRDVDRGDPAVRAGAHQ